MCVQVQAKNAAHQQRFIRHWISSWVWVMILAVKNGFVDRKLEYDCNFKNGVNQLCLTWITIGNFGTMPAAAAAIQEDRTSSKIGAEARLMIKMRLR